MNHVVNGVAGLLLAAGAGRRMGMPKALVEDGAGTPWVRRTARMLAAGGCRTVTVVVGAQAGRVRAALADEPVTVVEATDWQQGMGASLRAGLDALSAQHAGTAADADSGVVAALVHLVDLPDVGADAVQRLVHVAQSAGADAAAHLLARAWYGRGADAHPGHPVLLGRAHWQPIAAACTGDAGARGYLAARDVMRVDCTDLATGLDIDTPDRLAAAGHRSGHDAERPHS